MKKKKKKKKKLPHTPFFSLASPAVGRPPDTPNKHAPRHTPMVCPICVATAVVSQVRG